MPPPFLAELLLTVQLTGSHVAVVRDPAAFIPALLPLKVQLVMVIVPLLNRPPPFVAKLLLTAIGQRCRRNLQGHRHCRWDHVAADRAVGQGQCGVVCDSAAGLARGVARDSQSVRVKSPNSSTPPPRSARTTASRDGQPRHRRRHTLVDLEHAVQPAAADRHARRRACDRLRAARVAQLELPFERDGLGRDEDARWKR